MSVMRVLERGDHVAIGQPHKRMRMHVAGQVGEGPGDLRMQRVVHVEYEGAAHVVIVGNMPLAGITYSV